MALDNRIDGLRVTNIPTGSIVDFNSAVDARVLSQSVGLSCAAASGTGTLGNVNANNSSSVDLTLTEQFDTNGIMTVSSTTFTVPSGKYLIDLTSTYPPQSSYGTGVNLALSATAGSPTITTNINRSFGASDGSGFVKGTFYVNATASSTLKITWTNAASSGGSWGGGTINTYFIVTKIA